MAGPGARYDWVVRTIAGAFLDGIWHPPAMAARAHHDLGLLDGDATDHPAQPYDQLLDAAEAVVDQYADPPLDQPRSLRRLVGRLAAPLMVTVLDSAAMRRMTVTPVETAMVRRPWPVARLDAVGDLAAALGLRPNELAWFADVASLERSADDERLRHYRYRWADKAGHGTRLVEAPKYQLRRHQRWLLRYILDQIPTHAAAHGFTRGRSVHSFVQPHVGSGTLIVADLESFFTTVPASRVYGIFRTVGYPDAVAHVLTGLTTNAVPPAVMTRPWRTSHRLRWPHLPQGAPTSPALANLAAFSLDRRLTGLADSFGLTYTRYADDLAFSTTASLSPGAQVRLLRTLASVVASEGFRLNPRKTRVATPTQQQRLAGRVINEADNAPRRDYDRLRAVLHDAIRNGVSVANRGDHPDFEAHLRGRIHWVAWNHPNRRRRLWAMFDQITWTD